MGSALKRSTAESGGGQGLGFSVLEGVLGPRNEGLQGSRCALLRGICSASLADQRLQCGCISSEAGCCMCSSIHGDWDLHGLGALYIVSLWGYQSWSGAVTDGAKVKVLGFVGWVTY